MAYSRAWLISTLKTKIETLYAQLDTLAADTDNGVSYSLPTGHSYSKQSQVSQIQSLLEYYERRLRELQPGYQVTRGL